MFALGGLWFSPVLFGRGWAESMKASPKELGSPAVAFALFLLTSTGIAFLVALLFSGSGMDTNVIGRPCNPHEPFPTEPKSATAAAPGFCAAACCWMLRHHPWNRVSFTRSSRI